MTEDAPRVPDSTALASVQELCDFATPYATGEALDQLFCAAMRQCVAWHAARSPFYARLLADHGFVAAQLETTNDLEHLPFILANFFKAHEVLSIPPGDVYLHLTSSGTSGQKSQIFFDEWTIRGAQRMVDFIFAHYGWTTVTEPTNYLLYSYEPQPGFKVGTSYTDNFLLKYAQVNRVEYALKNTGDGRHEFDPFGCIRALQSFAEEGLPVRIFGFPAFMHFTLERMRAMGVAPLKLHPRSLTFFGGGWKGHQDQAIAKPALYAEIARMLAVPDERIRDGFGSVEHCIPYVECSMHEFHVPVWSRVQIRDVRTMAVLGYGRPGYLSFISPYITSVPAHHVIMGDLAQLEAPENCRCGLATPFFRVLGRAGLSRNKSCAVAAAELLRRPS